MLALETVSYTHLIFEEQIIRHAAALDYPSQGMGDSGEYLERYLGDAYKGCLLYTSSSTMKAWQKRITSRSDLPLVLKSEPPLAPPMLSLIHI